MGVLAEFLIPPLAALAIFLAISYVVLPLYRQRQRYAQYVPISIPSGAALPIPDSWRERLLNVLSPLPGFRAQFLQGGREADPRYSGLSDEEMDPVDDFDQLHGHLTDFDGRGGRPAAAGGRSAGAAGGARMARRERDEDVPRLSRDLEAGFRDDSDDDDDDDDAEQNTRGRSRR